MDAAAWDERYAATDARVVGRPQPVRRAGAGRPAARPRARPRLRGGPQRALARRPRLAGHRDRLVGRRGRQGPHRSNDAVDWQVGDALTAPLPTDLDLVVLAYFQVTRPTRADGRPPGVRGTRGPAAPSSLVAHDSTNLTEGTGGPQDPAVLYTAEDVLDDLDGADLEVVRAERVPRIVEAGTAWDALVRVVRRDPHPAPGVRVRGPTRVGQGRRRGARHHRVRGVDEPQAAAHRARRPALHAVRRPASRSPRAGCGWPAGRWRSSDLQSRTVLEVSEAGNGRRMLRLASSEPVRRARRTRA